MNIIFDDIDEIETWIGGFAALDEITDYVALRDPENLHRLHGVIVDDSETEIGHFDQSFAVLYV